MGCLGLGFCMYRDLRSVRYTTAGTLPLIERLIRMRPCWPGPMQWAQNECKNAPYLMLFRISG